MLVAEDVGVAEGVGVLPLEDVGEEVGWLGEEVGWAVDVSGEVGVVEVANEVG